MSAIPSLRRSVEIGVGAAMGAEEEARRLQASIHAREVSLKVFDPFEEGELMALLPILKDLKKVKTIALEATDRNTACRIPLRALSLAVNRTAKLEDFFLAQLTFEGSIEDMETFAETLKRRQTLREFFLVECQLPRPARASSLEPVARGLAGLPHVRVVYLHAREMDGLGSLSTEAVSALCESQTIKELKLYHFDLPDDQVMTVARHLESNQVIEELGLSSCNLNSVMTTAAICKMLRQNSALHSLELVPKAIIQDNYSMLIAEALEGNVSLKSFSLGGNFSVSQACKDAFEQALEENYQLVSFRLMSLLGSDLPEHQMYLRLNQAGRAHLPKANRNEWINVLHRASDSLDCIYYIISINPYLCHTTKETQSQVRTQWRGNKKRRLNDDQDIATPQNSSSVNSSLSSSENSSSPTQSEQSNEERNTSTNSDNVAQHGKLPLDTYFCHLLNTA